VELVKLEGKASNYSSSLGLAQVIAVYEEALEIQAINQIVSKRIITQIMYE
jgi:hypothetical protein